MGYVCWIHQSCPLLAPQAVGDTYRNFLQRWVGMGSSPSPWTHQPSVAQGRPRETCSPSTTFRSLSLFQLLQIFLLRLWMQVSSHLFLCQWPSQHNPSSHPGSAYVVHSCHLEKETQCRRVFSKKNKNSSPLLVMPSSSAVSPAPRMPSGTGGYSQMCFAEYPPPAPLAPMSEASALTLLVFSFTVPISSCLPSLCFILHCSLPHSITYRASTALCSLLFTLLQTPM